MTGRERFLKIARFEQPNDVYLSPFCHAVWQETLARWVAEGAPEAILHSNVPRYNYFGLERLGMVHAEASLLSNMPIGGGPPGFPPVRPRFERKVVEEDERTRVIIDEGGVTLREFKDDFQSMPQWLDAPVKNRKDWQEYKKRLEPHTPERWLAEDWDAYAERLRERDYPLGADIGSFYGLIRTWVGTERFMYMFYDDPQLVHDMMEHMEYFYMEIAKKVLEKIELDFVIIFEDMAWKGGSFLSPKMFREFMLPHYKNLCGLLRSKGVDIIFVDSDGDISELIPLWLEGGVNGVFPLEVAAGMDAVQLRKKYGKELILWGNIDKRALIKGKDAIKEELDKKVPFLISQGGYFPGIDHLVPPDISLENFNFYIEYIRSLV